MMFDLDVRDHIQRKLYQLGGRHFLNVYIEADNMIENSKLQPRHDLMNDEHHHAVIATSAGVQPMIYAQRNLLVLNSLPDRIDHSSGEFLDQNFEFDAMDDQIPRPSRVENFQKTVVLMTLLGKRV